MNFWRNPGNPGKGVSLKIPMSKTYSFYASLKVWRVPTGKTGILSLCANATLFYSRTGFYFFLQAFYVLHEKGVPFKEHIVHIHFGEQHEDWYLRMNPNGKVPVLKDGDKIVCESEEIINYVDKRCPSGKTLS